MGRVVTAPRGKRLVSSDTISSIKEQGFNSDYQSLQVVRIYTCRFTITAEAGLSGSNERAIPHKLPYVPAFLSYINTGDNNFQLSSQTLELGSHIQTYTHVYVDETNVTMYGRIDNTDIFPDATTNFEFYVFLFSTELD